MPEDKKSYYAVIPANVRYDKRLTPNAKLLYGEITALCNEKGYCWATNNYFGDLYDVSKQSISAWISQLSEFGYIRIDIEYKTGSKEILHRYIRIFEYPIQENLNTPIQENLKDNITSSNTTFNIKKNTSLPPESINLSILLSELHRTNIDKQAKEQTTARIQAWAKDIDMLNRLDGRSWEDIEKAIRWIKTPGCFWAPNIMSGKKLREKFDTVWAQMNSKKVDNKPNPYAVYGFANAEEYYASLSSKGKK